MARSASGKEEIRLSLIERKPVYASGVIDVGIDTVALPNGRQAQLDIVRHPGGSAVVAIDGAGRVCMIRQFRHAADGYLWELPAGKREPEETPELTARRELADEAGIAARAWRPLGVIHPSPAIFTEEIHLYLARELGPAPRAHESHEVIEVHWLDFADALAHAVDGEYSDAKTVIGLVRAASVLESEQR